MALAVRREPWCVQAGAGVAVDGATCPAAVVPLEAGGSGSARHIARCWSGSGVARDWCYGAGGRILPPRRLFSNCERCRGRRPLGAGCWLFGSEPCGGPGVLRGAGTDGGGGERGAAPGPPTSPPCLVLPGAPLSVCAVRGAGLCGGGIAGPSSATVRQVRQNAVLGRACGLRFVPVPDPALPHGTGASLAQSSCGSARCGPGTALPPCWQVLRGHGTGCKC